MTPETLLTLAAGSYRVVVQTNPWHAIDPENESRYYVLVLTADGTTDDSHGVNTLAGATRKAESLRKRLYREGFATI